jgi:hypothetical protein
LLLFLKEEGFIWFIGFSAAWWGECGRAAHIMADRKEREKRE